MLLALLPVPLVLLVLPALDGDDKKLKNKHSAANSTQKAGHTSSMSFASSWNTRSFIRNLVMGASLSWLRGGPGGAVSGVVVDDIADKYSQENCDKTDRR
jgi:hypothetical protein